ncbi:hypothetical protein Tco_1532477 [Tanacetum coccineum]
MKGVGLSFPDFLLVRYGGYQLNDSIWGQSYVEWYKENSHDNKPRPRDYNFKEWMIVKVRHTDVNESVKKAFQKSWVIDCFEEALDLDKDLMERSFDDYKWVFDLEIEQVADEYELGIKKRLNEELQDIRNKYNELREGNASKNNLNDDRPMCERHEANYIQSEGHQNRISHDSYSHQTYHDPNDSEKSLKELNNDVKNDLKDFKRRIRSMRTVHWKLFARDDVKITGVLPNKESKTVNQEPQSKTDFKKSITKFLDDQRVTNMFFKNNVNDMILKIKQNKKNFQSKIKNMERKIDEWSKSQNVSLEHTDRTNPPPPQAHTKQVNVVFTGSGKSDDHPKIQKRFTTFYHR